MHHHSVRGRVEGSRFCEKNPKIYSDESHFGILPVVTVLDKIERSILFLYHEADREVLFPFLAVLLYLVTSK